MPLSSNAQALNAIKENLFTIEGTITDIHIYGQVAEKVMICHFDPRFVVVVNTADGVRKFAIHSPTRTFMEEKPIGDVYKFTMEKQGQSCQIKKTEK